MSPDQVGESVIQEFLPKVSVVIPIYNGEEDLPALINCLKAQTYPRERVEYLLVDNNSRDRTSDILQAAAQEAMSEGMTFKHLSETQIQSSYAARNKGIRAAKGEILAFTDADCHPTHEWLQALVQPFTEPTVGIVAGEVTALPGKTLLERYADLQNTLSQKYTLAHPFRPYGQTANVALRRETLKQAGLFRPYMTTGGDADLCWRIQQQGVWQIRFAEQAIVQHRHRTTLEDLQKQWRRYGCSNRYLHELYGVPLNRELKRKDYVYRWSRWLLKELPIAATKTIIRQATLADIVSTPLNLICTRARAAGQREAKLSEQARQIEWSLGNPSELSADILDECTNSAIE